MAGIVVTRIIPNITKEENERRWKQLEQTLSHLLKAKVTYKG